VPRDEREPLRPTQSGRALRGAAHAGGYSQAAPHLNDSQKAEAFGSHACCDGSFTTASGAATMEGQPNRSRADDFNLIAAMAASTSSSNTIIIMTISTSTR
jgi:hypothetical protein